MAETGTGSDGTVLLLPALGLSHTMWAPAAATLPGCLILAPDLPGFGHSREDSGGIDAAVRECAALLQARSQPAVVVGVSYGGYIAALLAAGHPELVSGLALSGVRRQVPRVAASLQSVLFRGVRASSLGHGDPVPASALAAEKRNLIAAGHELGRIDLRPALVRIRASTVVFAPERDWFVRRDVPQVARAIPNALIVPVPKAGHLWMKSRPQLIGDAVTRLLRDTRARSTAG